VTLGEGAREQAYNLNRIGRWGGSISSGDGKKAKNHGIVHRVAHDFYMKINTRQKSGDAVACANIAPVQLHCLICHNGNKYMAYHYTAEEEWGGEVLLHYWHLGAAHQHLLFWGLFLEAREDIPKNNF